MSRAECNTPPVANGVVGCSGFPLQSFVATACTLPADGGDPQVTCDRVFCHGDYSFDQCNVDKAEAANLPSVGVCISDPSASLLSNVSFFQRSLACTGSNCQIQTATGTRCVDVTGQPAITTLMPASDRGLRSVEIIQYVANGCQPAAATGALTYALAGPLGTVQGGGLQANLTATSGLTKVTQICDPDSGCTPSSLDSFRANLADVTVGGVALTNVVVHTAFAAPVTNISDGEGTVLGIAPGDLELVLDGRMAGTRMLYSVQNSAPIPVDALASGFRMTGALDIRGLSPTQGAVPVTVTFDAQGQPATSAQQTCATATPTEVLFGFDSAAGWSSSQAAVAEVSAPTTQGCGALAVSGQGYMLITGDVFSTARITRAAALSVDLFIPDHQPNPFWLGNLQGFLTCPSGNVFNQYIGQVELTGKPQNRYSTLRFPLPAAVFATLGRPLDDCSLSFGLNVNATGKNWLFDNLRFTP
jgi:hypothetical protein